MNKRRVGRWLFGGLALAGSLNYGLPALFSGDFVRVCFAVLGVIGGFLIIFNPRILPSITKEIWG